MKRWPGCSAATGDRRRRLPVPDVGVHRRADGRPSSYLAAVYLAADARRLGERALERGFQVRAHAAGVVAGTLTITGLFVVRQDAQPIGDGLTSGGGRLVLVCGSAAGLATLVLVWRSRLGPARASATLAVAAIVAGWAVAQRPRFLPGATPDELASLQGW